VSEFNSEVNLMVTNAPLVVLIALMLLHSIAAFADEVAMAFDDRIPPYCFPETNSGIAVEVIREALAYRGHVLKPLYYPVARVPAAFKAGQVDAAMSDMGEDLSAAGGYYGDSAVRYENVFITLKSRHIEIRKPADLQSLSVIAYPGALLRYPEWLTAVQAAGNYREQNDQSTQVLTLNEGRYDVVLSDRGIFKYFTLKLQREKGLVPKPTQAQVFVAQQSRDYRTVFRNPTIRDDFNAGLQHEKDSGRYRAIYDKYLK